MGTCHERKLHRLHLPDGEVISQIATSEEQARAKIARRLASRTAGKLVRARRRNRLTGVTVELIDTHHPDSHLDSDGGRWATICDHGSLVNHESLALARQFLSCPWEYCEACDELLGSSDG